MTHTVDVRQLLVTHIRQLRQQHKAGITPTYGQIDDLFDLGERLEGEIRTTEPTMPCALPAGCTTPATERVGTATYCARHAQALRALTQLVVEDADSIAIARLCDMERGRAPWPAAVAEARA